MRDKIEALAHIDADTRATVLQWCRDYETEIAYMKRQSEILHQRKRGDTQEKLIRFTLANVSSALCRAGHCDVYYDGRFKVLTDSHRIAKETSYHVGSYNKDYTRGDLLEDLLHTLEVHHAEISKIRDNI